MQEILFFFYANRRELSELLAESKYYCVEELSDAAEKAVRSLREREREAQDAVVPICRVPLITSKKEEQVRVANEQKRGGRDCLWSIFFGPTYIDIFEHFSDCPFQHALRFTRSPLPDLFRAALACSVLAQK